MVSEKEHGVVWSDVVFCGRRMTKDFIWQPTIPAKLREEMRLWMTQEVLLHDLFSE